MGKHAKKGCDQKGRNATTGAASKSVRSRKVSSVSKRSFPERTNANGACKTTPVARCVEHVSPKISRKSLADLVLQRPASGMSTKCLRADLNILMKHIGQLCPHFGKRGVVQLSSPSKSKGSENVSSSPPKFNKFAGWVEWENAVFLWVNATGGSFDNIFQPGGIINWYVGGANPTAKSPIVQKLLTSSKNNCVQVFLFVRCRSTEPYVCCGECNYVRHDENKVGFEFTWKLKDWPRLQKSPSFQELLRIQNSKNDDCKKAWTARTVRRWAT